MTEATLEPGGPLRREEVNASPHWVRRALLVVFCLGLLAAIGAVFTQVIAARVPEQRATLERLITDRTGLAVRFDNVHFAWGMEGTSAVFERVELTDPVRGRVRVVAPELRVEFDAWDFLRHQQFSLGHVMLSSPDIDIIGDAETVAEALPSRKHAREPGATLRRADEAALVRQFTAWVELMPVGRVEVEGARVHLYRRGERAARHHFTLSQAVVSRGTRSFNAFGTLLLSQDIGQSLFVSAKLDDIGIEGATPAADGVNGELRLIARRVFLEKLPPVAGASLAARGRGTVDARIGLRQGRIHEGSWQLSARELRLPGGARFDHFTVQGRLSRAPDGFAVELTDLQLTRGARLERAPRISLQVGLAPGTLQPAGITARAERVPFMAAQFIAGALAPRFTVAPGLEDTGWAATAGELHDVRFDSRTRAFAARASGAELTRASDGARLANLSAGIAILGEESRIAFDDVPGAQWWIGAAEPRPVQFAGAVTFRPDAAVEFTALHLQSEQAAVRADGPWGADRARRRPLVVELARIDHALLGDLWSLLALEPPAHFADLEAGQVVNGRLSLVPMADPTKGIVDWQRSRGSLELAGLVSAGADVPRLAAAAGKLEFSRGAAQLHLVRGQIEDLRLTDARIEWPRRGAARLRAAAEGDLNSPLLRRALQEQGLERFAGTVALEAEARGEAEMRKPESWRVTAHVRDATLPLAGGVPPIERLNGTVRLAGGALRSLALAGSWLDGPVEIETRRTAAPRIASANASADVSANVSANVNGIAEAASLLGLLGQAEVAAQVDGHIAWSGTLRRLGADTEGWRLSLASNLTGFESRLAPPFDKPRSRALPVAGELRFDAQGVREFALDSGRNRLQGRVQQGIVQVRFDLQGLSGELHAAADSSEARVAIDRLEVQRAPAVLAAAGSLLPQDHELAVQVGELRHADRGLGSLRAALSRHSAGLEFSLESADGSPHHLDATGRCAADQRCRMEFTVHTRELPGLLGDASLPPEWPTQSLRAYGELSWPGGDLDLVHALAGNFELETEGTDSSHQLLATALLADGRIELMNVQGTGPEPDLVFRGSGRVGLAARTYDLTVDYEQISLAASAVPTPARVRLSRAWSSLRGSVAKRGWAETPPARRVQWHGSWD